MSNVSLKLTSQRKWSIVHLGSRKIYCTGWAFVGESLLDAPALAQWMGKQAHSIETFEHALRQLDGNFAIAIVEDNAIYLGVDRIRSIPLFYRCDGEHFIASDALEEIRNPDDSVDRTSEVEYVCAGYVTGPHTLFSNISGLQAAECVCWSTSKNIVEKRRYGCYLCMYNTSKPIELLCQELDDVIRLSFKQVITSIDGRCVVVPLSGGLDSRLVVSMLKQLGYDNVICFAYGTPHNHEATRSRQVAEALGYRWLKIDYSANEWKYALNSESMRSYWAFSANGVSMPHPDDWLAVQRLKSMSEIENDAVFVPGHTGDFICGGHLKYLFDPLWHDDPYDFETAMIKKHYSMWDDLATLPHIREVIIQRIHETLEGFPRDTHEDLARMYEYWEWQERQAKLIIDAVRVYEYFGFDWRIPLWHRGIMEFWKRIPISLKMDKYLYRIYLHTHDPLKLFQDCKPDGLWQPEQALKTLQHRRRYRLESAVKSIPIVRNLLHSALRIRDHLNMYHNHPIGLAGAYGRPWGYALCHLSKRNPYSLYLKDFLFKEYGLRLSSLKSK